MKSFFRSKLSRVMIGVRGLTIFRNRTIRRYAKKVLTCFCYTLYGKFKIINKCKVNVLPSIEDGFGLVVPQTAAAGCPSIVSENAGASDIVKKNKSGFSVTARNSNTILEKLQLLADDKNLLIEMSQNALNNSKINSWENYVTKLNEIVDHL